MNAKPNRNWGADIFKDAMWAAGYEPAALKEALYALNVQCSSLKQDQTEATDFIVSDIGGPRWGSRIRRRESTRGNIDITFRNWRKGCSETEVSKLKHVDLYLYAWVDKFGILEWIVFAVKPLLASGLLDRAREIVNRDGKTSFIYVNAYDLQDIPKCLIAGRKESPCVSYVWTTSDD